MLPMMTMTKMTATTKMLMHAVKPRSHSNHSVVPFTAAHLGLGLWLGAIRRFNHLTKLRTIDVPPPASPPLSGDPELDRPPDRPLAHCEARPPPAAAERAVRGTGLRVPVGGFFFPMGGGRGFRCFFVPHIKRYLTPELPPPQQDRAPGCGWGLALLGPKKRLWPQSPYPAVPGYANPYGPPAYGAPGYADMLPSPDTQNQHEEPGQALPCPRRSPVIRSSGW